jgi:hypothetical protein
MLKLIRNMGVTAEHDPAENGTVRAQCWLAHVAWGRAGQNHALPMQRWNGALW